MPYNKILNVKEFFLLLQAEIRFRPKLLFICSLMKVNQDMWAESAEAVEYADCIPAVCVCGGGDKTPPKSVLDTTSNYIWW